MHTQTLQGGVWSATPTPFTADGELDVGSVQRMASHHLKLGVSGIMLAGTCGEGPWMRLSDRETLTRTVAAVTAGRIPIALQVTDNSAGRTLDNIDLAAQWGADLAVVEAPYFLLNTTPSRLLAYYRQVATQSVLPIGLYDRGASRPYSVPQHGLLDLLVGEPAIVMVKDSSMSAERRSIFLQAKKCRADLLLLGGDEFDCVTYLCAGYDGLLLGGGVFNASMAKQIIARVRAGDLQGAAALQVRMTDLMFRVYGGQSIECWLAGLKELLVQLGVFTTRTDLLGYPLTDTCLAAITAAVNGTDGLGFQADLMPDACADHAPVAAAAGL